MEKKNHAGGRRTALKKQSAKSLSGHVRARNRGISRTLPVNQHGAQLMMWQESW